MTLSSFPPSHPHCTPQWFFGGFFQCQLSPMAPVTLTELSVGPECPLCPQGLSPGPKCPGGSAGPVCPCLFHFWAPPGTGMLECGRTWIHYILLTCKIFIYWYIWIDTNGYSINIFNNIELFSYLYRRYTIYSNNSILESWYRYM